MPCLYVKEFIIRWKLYFIYIKFGLEIFFLQVYNKIDQVSIQEVDRLARTPHTVVISCNMKLNLDYMIEKLWEHLNLIKVFTKKRGEKPDLVDGIILRNGATVEAVAHAIHRSLVDSLKYALVWVGILLWVVNLRNNRTRRWLIILTKNREQVLNSIRKEWDQRTSCSMKTSFRLFQNKKQKKVMFSLILYNN